MYETCTMFLFFTRHIKAHDNDKFLINKLINHIYVKLFLCVSRVVYDHIDFYETIPHQFSYKHIPLYI